MGKSPATGWLAYFPVNALASIRKRRVKIDHSAELIAQKLAKGQTTETFQPSKSWAWAMFGR